MINVLTLFSGIGAPEKALENLNIDFNLVNYCEIDSHASRAFSLIHNVPESKNLGDITKVNCSNMPPIDLLVYGFPCQDISLAGQGKGLETIDSVTGERVKTRSGLVWDAHRIIEQTKPKIAICENVKNLVSKKFEKEFNAILENLEQIGYTNYWQVLKASDYGIPQQRERVFIVSIRKDCNNNLFEFPKPFPLKHTLKDFLDLKPNQNHYCKDYVEARLRKDFESKHGPIIHNENTESVRTITTRIGNFGNFEQYIEDDKYMVDNKSIEPFLISGNNGVDSQIIIKTNNSKGFDIAKDGDYVNISQPKSQTRRGRIGHQIAQTLDTSSSSHCIAIGNPLRLRRFTPYECFALMGFDKSDCQKLYDANIRESQMFKMAGNSIVVDVLEEIFCQIFDENGEIYV